MKYSEFKNPDRPQDTHSKLAFSCLQEYLAHRSACEEYERCDISDELSAEDYLKFEKNFERIMDSIASCSEEGEKSQLEQVHEMMEEQGWEWATIGCTPTAAQIEDQFRNLFKHCMELGKARGYASTGGCTVETDIYHHSVHCSFNHVETMTDDTIDYCV